MRFIIVPNLSEAQDKSHGARRTQRVGQLKAHSQRLFKTSKDIEWTRVGRKRLARGHRAKAAADYYGPKWPKGGSEYKRISKANLRHAAGQDRKWRAKKNVGTTKP